MSWAHDSNPLLCCTNSGGPASLLVNTKGIFVSLQVEVLSSVHEQRVTFQDEYKHFATALDTTRHELPVKELCVDENKGQFLGMAVQCLPGFPVCV